MSTPVLILLIIFCLVLLIFIAVLLDVPILGVRSTRQQMKAMVSVQRQGREADRRDSSLHDAAALNAVARTRKIGRITLEKRFRYAQWRMPVAAYHACQIGIGLAAFSFLSWLECVWFVRLIGLITLGPIVMGWLLNASIDRRFSLFEKDYAAFLLSVVALLKTGMNTTTALETAASDLDPASLVKSEIETMVERIRVGVPEDKSIGAFGEDILHPEIELFVQALLLSKEVGGNLSETLERLARQVRKRQYFRQQAFAAVGLQRASGYFILAILAGLEGFIAWTYPQAVFDAMKTPLGWQVWNYAGLMIFAGLYWMNQVTKMKI